MPKKIIIVAALLCAPVLCHAAPRDDFEYRVGAGNQVYTTLDGMKYMQSLTPKVTKAMQSCIAPGSAPPGAAGKFVFVANVTRGSLVTAGAVRPTTTLSQCFAIQFTQNTLPPPPLPMLGDAQIFYPIVVEMNVTP